MKRFLGLAIMLMLAMSLMTVAACKKAGGGDPLLGTWEMVDNPGKTIKITKEGEQYFYEGSQGKSQAVKKDENTLLVPMGPIEVTVALDPASGVLGVSFMGESYKYKKAAK